MKPGAAMVNAPAFSIIALLIIFSTLRLNILEECFLLFAAHPLILCAALLPAAGAAQWLSERNIRKLEFEFY